MADSGFKYATARTLEAGSDPGTTLWNGPCEVSRIQTINADYWPTLGYWGYPNYNSALTYYYDFSIPPGASIDGLEIASTLKYTGAEWYAYMWIYLSWDGGVSWVSKNISRWCAPPPGGLIFTFSLGGATDKWGRTWAPTEFTNSALRVRLRLSKSDWGGELAIDYLGLKVYYTAGTAHALSGTIPGASDVSGDVLKMILLEGPSNGVSALSGNINSITPTPFAGVISAVSSLPNTTLGNISDALNGSVDAVSSANGFLKPKFSVLYVPNHVEQMQSRLIEPFK